MPFFAIRKHKCTFLLLSAIAVSLFIIIGIFLAGYTAHNGTKFEAEAAVPAVHTNLVTGRGLNIYDTTFYSGIYTYDNLITSGTTNKVGTSNGDYHFSNMPGEIVSPISDDGIPVVKTARVPKGQNRSYDPDNATTYDTFSYDSISFFTTGAVAADASITITVPIAFNSNLYKAINDNLLDVKINAYANMLNFGLGSGTDYAKSTIIYNNGAMSTSSERTVTFPETPYSDKQYEYAMSSTLNPTTCGAGAYIQLTFSDFQKNGDNVYIVFSKFAFRITVTTRDFAFRSPDEGDVQVIDADGTRNPLATTDMVKRGDIIFITTYLQQNNTIFTLNNGTAGDTTATGRFYRNLMLNSEIGTARTSTKTLSGTDYLIEGVETYTNHDLVTWQYDKTALTRIYTFTDNESIEQDLTVGYTALSAAFYVNDSTKETVNITCSMKDSFGNIIRGQNDMNGGDSGQVYTYIIDSQLPNAPNLNATSIFYQKYISNKSYYTKLAGYNYENDGLGNRQVKSVTIGSQSEGSDASMTSQTTALQGLSSEIVYYRVTPLEREPNNFTSELFTKEQANGIYCLTQPTLAMQGGKYVVTKKTTIYQGMELMLRQGDSPENYTYPKQGIYKVEFITYDYVGNISSNSSAVIIRVDVADYTFDVVTKVGSTEVTSLTNETFSLNYFALNDNNVLESRGNATFKRGDRIVLKLDFTSTGYSKYILTYFRTPAGFSLNTSDFPYDSYDAIFLTNKAQSTAVPTFTLDGNYSGDDKAENRKLILTFKMRALISVTNTSQVYEPNTPRNVNTIATVDGKKVTNITIITTYSESPDGPFRALSPDFPVNAGTYYYRSELNSTNYYGFATNKMTIIPATPTVSELKITAIDYGQSLAVRDTVYNQALQRYVMSDSIFCSYTYFDEGSGTNRKISVYNRSSNGVYGYFSIVDPSKTSTNYSKPSAGTMRIKIQFTPIVMVDQYTPLYAGGNFVPNTNYFPVTVSDVTLTINHSTNVTKTVENVNELGKVVKEYSGAPQNAKITISAIDDGRTILLSDYIVYTFTNQATGVTNAVVPTNAGNYTINYSLNKNSCNYTGSWTQEFVILKRKLIVICENVTAQFQREVKPNPLARYYYTGGSTDYAGLNYNYIYYYYQEGKSNAEMAIEENRVPNNASAMFNNLPCVAGKYLVKVSINDTNLENESDTFITYTIQKVSSLGSAYITAEFPNLNWTSSTSGYHLHYLQPLKAVSIATNQDTVVRYSNHYMDLGKVKYRFEAVAGRFLVAQSQYAGDYSAQSVADFILAQNEFASLNVGMHSLYLYFVPSNENLVNFNLIYIPVNVNVGKAQPIFYDVEATPITYGKVINSIDDITLSKDDAGKKAIKFKLYTDPTLGVQYYYMPSTQYTYSLYTVSSPVLNAGVNNIVVTFKPTDTVNFEQANGTVSLTVNKKSIDVSFERNDKYNEATDTYIYPYKTYAHAAKLLDTNQLVKPADNPQGAYAFYKYDAGNIQGSYKGASYINAILVTGKYVVEYTINDANYSGKNYYVVDIIKDTLKKYTDPIINLAATAVSYGKLMSAVSFSGGSMLSVATGAKIDGTYYFNYEQGTVFTVMGQQSLNLKFVPNDTENYNVYTGEGANNYRINVNVTRANISQGLTLSVRQDYVYGDLAFDWNFTDVSYTSTIYTDGVNFAGSKLDDNYHYIEGTYSINNRPMQGFFNAGNYSVTFTVREDNQIYYTGSITVPLTIAKKKAIIEVEQNVKPFDNKSQSVDVGVFLAEIDGETVTKGTRLNETVVQTFYKSGVKLNVRPSAIGVYTVELALQSVNYEYYYGSKLTSSFTIKVDENQILINNLNQVYSVPRALGVSLGINSAVYTIKYIDVNTLTEYLALPVNAGIYDVKLTFDEVGNNGYAGEVIYKDKLIIDKYTANITTSDIISTVYTGNANAISVRTEPYNLPYTITYRKQGETEFTAVEALNANINNGYHEIKFVINSSNYKGEKIIRYYILPAALTIESHPTFGSYIYNTDIQPTLNTRGVVRFGYETIIEFGHYEIPLVNINHLDAGTYSVPYNFTAQNAMGETDTNYKTATGNCNLVIVKQNIPQNRIIIPDNILMSVNYNTSYHYVYACLCDGLDTTCVKSYDVNNIDKDGLIYNIKTSNKDFAIKIKYNGSSTPARSLGEYTISAEIVSKNYTGNAVFAKKLVVAPGAPDIRVLPQVKESVNLNITYDGETYTYPTVASGDIKAGEAFIAGTNTRISGSFSVIAGQTLNKANINYLNILFTPTDNNFATKTVTIEVKVNGINPLAGIVNNKTADWSNLSVTSNINGKVYDSVTIAARAISSPNFGARLSDFELYFRNGDGSENLDYASFGLLSFVNSTYIPDVGEKVAIKFTPYDTENAPYNYIYNEMLGMLSLPLLKIDAPESFSYHLKGFEGRTLTQDMVFEIYDGFDKVTLKGGALTIYTDAALSQLFSLTSPIFFDDVNNDPVFIVYSSTNYNDIECEIYIDVYNRIASSDINVAKLSKEYSDNNGIIISDLEPLLNTMVSIGYQSITLIITDSQGNITDGRAIGTYNITLIVDDGNYYGQKQINGFTVVRKDITNSISLTSNTSTFGDITLPTVSYNGSPLNPSFYTMQYKLSASLDTSYSTNMGEDAAEYSIKVTVNSQNYTGSKVFAFTVTPIKVRVFAPNLEVIYSSLESLSAPEVTFKSLTSEDELPLSYTLYYYNNNYTLSTIKPSDTGVYKVRVIIDDTNYTPEGTMYNYVEFNYTITKASIIITAVPDVLSTIGGDGFAYNIKYGQALSDLRLTGGEARRNNIPVSGTFTVQNPSYRPNAGNYVLTIVFTPYNSNYASAQANYQIKIAKGDAQVIVDNLYAKYDSISKKNWITVSVQPAGVQVAITYQNSKGEQIAEPTNAGTYYINATSLNDNYNVTISRSLDGSLTPRLVITKAKVDITKLVVNPVALSISAGDSLAKSSLTGGEVYFEGFSLPIAGSFTYIQSALIFNTAGVYQTGYLFTPNDINNFDTYTGIVPIKVNKAYATITVSNTNFVYGEGFTMPKFTTSPAGLSYEHNITFNEYNPTLAYSDSDVIPAGTYYFRVWITSPNYSREENYLDFAIYVAKKNIDLSFVNSQNEVVTQYITTYGVPLDAKIKLYPKNNDQGKVGYLAKDEIVDNVKISDTLYIRYVSTDKNVSYNSHIAPKARGSYEVNISIINNNYTASGNIMYVINRGVIDEIIFDTDTLENQIYGNVKAPIIYTRPSNISYYIVYQGHDTVRPKDVGSYNIMVYFNDDNYEKKQVFAMFKINPRTITVGQIAVKDKVYDGVSAIEISGKLNGVRLEDEVWLTLSATTLNDKVDIGMHYVTITSYNITGLQAKNYVVEKPVYYGQVNIYTKVITANSSKSYVTSPTGFNAGTSVEVSELNVDENKTNIITKAMGVESTVVGFALKENGQETIMKDMIKVYIAIPEKYLSTEFTVKPAGDLAGQTVLFTREGNYITFHTTSSGSVVFEKTEFKYGFAVVVISLIVILIGVVVLIILNPLHSRTKTSDRTLEKQVIKRIRRGY